jgi:hypothetical protein
LSGFHRLAKSSYKQQMQELSMRTILFVGLTLILAGSAAAQTVPVVEDPELDWAHFGIPIETGEHVDWSISFDEPSDDSHIARIAASAWEHLSYSSSSLTGLSAASRKVQKFRVQRISLWSNDPHTFNVEVWGRIWGKGEVSSNEEADNQAVWEGEAWGGYQYQTAGGTFHTSYILTVDGGFDLPSDGIWAAPQA